MDFLCHENLDIVMLQVTKRESWDRRFVGSVWKARNKKWAVLSACGASGGVGIIETSNKFNCSKVVLASFSVTSQLNSDEEETFWLTSIYGHNKSNLRDF